MWPVNNGYFTARYWVADYWFDPAVILSSQRDIGAVFSPSNVGVVRTADDIETGG